MSQWGAKVCRYNSHNAGSLGWPFSVIKYKYIFQTKYAETNLSNSTRKLLSFEISKVLIAVLKSEIHSVIYYNFRHTFVPYGLKASLRGVPEAFCVTCHASACCARFNNS